MPNFWERRKKTNIKAVGEDDFVSFLRELGVYDSLGGEARCFSCGRKLGLRDIDAVFPSNGEVKFICGNSKCALAFGEKADYAE